MIKAILFDMDGTILDTEKHFVAAWQEAAHLCGVKEFGREHALMLRSLASKFAGPLMREIFGEAFPYEKIRETRRALMEEKFQSVPIEAKPGVEEIISYLKKKGYKFGIATASDFERAKEYLTKAGIFHCFEVENIICATEVENGKPYPDVYLHACAQLGEKPEDVIAVEDAPNGIMAAYRAGTKVIMVPDQTQPDEELEKLLYRKIEKLTDLIDIL